MFLFFVVLLIEFCFSLPPCERTLQCIHVQKHSVLSSALHGLKRLTSPLQTTQKNDAEGMLCVFRRLLLTENPAVREQMLSALRWLLRVIRQDGALSNDKGTFVLGKEAIVHTSSGQTQLLTDSTYCCLHMLCKVLAFCLQWYKLFSGLYCHAKLVHSPGVKKTQSMSASSLP